MVNANRQVPFAPSGSKRLLMLGAAGLLVLVGFVLQLGTLGYGHVQPSNLWIASTVVHSTWSMLILQLDGLSMHAVETYWPLLFVSLGLAILLLTRRGAVQPVPSRSPERQNHAR
jgi:hypothetical protein